jgi:hypothetical protein
MLSVGSPDSTVAVPLPPAASASFVGEGDLAGGVDRGDVLEDEDRDPCVLGGLDAGADGVGVQREDHDGVDLLRDPLVDPLVGRRQVDLVLRVELEHPGDLRPLLPQVDGQALGQSVEQGVAGSGVDVEDLLAGQGTVRGDVGGCRGGPLPG